MKRWIKDIKDQLPPRVILYTQTDDQISGLIEEIKSLKAQLTQAQRAIREKDEALRVYADRTNWNCIDLAHPINQDWWQPPGNGWEMAEQALTGPCR